MANTIQENSEMTVKEITANEAPRVTNISGASRIGLVSESTIRRWIRQGKLSAVKINGIIRISRDDLERLLGLGNVVVRAGQICETR